jgi:hypothetical protein
MVVPNDGVIVIITSEKREKKLIFEFIVVSSSIDFFLSLPFYRYRWIPERIVDRQKPCAFSLSGM